MASLSAALETLGCKVNQYESSFILETLENAGYRLVPFRERADIYIVHSCAVTSKAAFQTRQLLRRAHRKNPGALIVAAGCDAQLEACRLADERLATHILGTAEKLDVARWLEVNGSLESPLIAAADSRRLTAFRSVPVTGMLSGRARAYLKVQDGCDAFCSYCVVPYTRGCARSLPPHEVRGQMDRLLASGYQEVVLTGIHLGQWGKDLDPSQELTDLLEHLKNGPLPSRLRLSSLETTEWNPRLIETVASYPGLCPHFHVPLQSGDEEILERMDRPYGPEQYEVVLRELRRLFPYAAIGADVLVGFPGETEQHFQNTLDVVRRAPLSYCHVFPYSPRQGTPAASWPGRVTGSELKRRARVIRELSAEKRRTFHEQLLNRWLEVLVECEEKPGFWKGTSDNYVQVLFRFDRPLNPGMLVRVRPTQLADPGLIGVVEHAYP